MDGRISNGMNLGDRPQSMMGRTDDGASESWAFVNGSMPGCYVSSVVCDSLQPYRLQPTRLLCPWNFPGKNTGVGSLFPGDLPNPGIEPTSLMSPALAGRFFTTSAT